jgi:TnsA endonuclease N terminal
MSYKGFFRPKHPSKYKGDPSNIVYRSLWELRFMMYLDGHPNVLKWASEEIVIPYRSPIDGKVHRYFPDFWVKLKSQAGKEEIQLIEIKPEKQTRPPQIQQRTTKKYLNEVVTWGVNEAKWKAAKQYCDEKNWQFKIFTEKELGLKK